MAGVIVQSIEYIPRNNRRTLRTNCEPQGTGGRKHVELRESGELKPQESESGERRSRSKCLFGRESGENARAEGCRNQPKSGPFLYFKNATGQYQRGNSGYQREQAEKHDGRDHKYGLMLGARQRKPQQCESGRH